MNPNEASQILREMGIMIELIDPIPQKSISYKKAAKAIENYSDLIPLIQENQLESLPGIGKKMSEMISRLILTGRLHYYENLKKRIPSGFFELLNVPGLNTRKVRILYEKLHITNLKELKEAIENEELKKIKLFPSSSLNKLKIALENIKDKGHSLLYPKALILAERIMKRLLASGTVKKMMISGDLRRKCEVIYELNFVAAVKDKQLFVISIQYDTSISQIIEQDDMHVIAKLNNGIILHVRLVTEREFSYVLLLDTGNKEHIEKLLEEAKKRNISLQTLSIYENESEIYSNIGFSFIPPELRENQGEIEAAKTHNLPKLIEYSDLKGIFHCHTDESDGTLSLEEMI